MNPTREYFVLDGYDRKARFWLLHEEQSAAPPRVRQRYASLVCPVCNRLDALKALRRGLEPGVCPPARFPDIGWTDDHLCVISRQTKRVLASVRGVQAHYFELPEAAGYFAVFPKRVFHPPATTRKYQGDEPPRFAEPFQIRKGACKSCGRLREVTWISEWYEIPKRVPFAGVAVGYGKSSVALIISGEVRAAFEAAKITGWRTHAITGCALDPPDAKTLPDPASFNFPFFDRQAWLARKRRRVAQKRARAAADKGSPKRRRSR